MQTSGSQPELACLVESIDQAYNRKAWHGPNLKGSIRGVSAALAAWRPGPDRRNIAEIVLHCAYWKDKVRRRILAVKRGEIPLKGQNWVTVAHPLAKAEWRNHAGLLEQTHKSLRAEVANLDADRLRTKPAGGKYSYRQLLIGIALHDVYHVGQIQLIKRLYH